MCDEGLEQVERFLRERKGRRERGREQTTQGQQQQYITRRGKCGLHCTAPTPLSTAKAPGKCGKCEGGGGGGGSDGVVVVSYTYRRGGSGGD